MPVILDKPCDQVAVTLPASANQAVGVVLARSARNASIVAVTTAGLVSWDGPDRTSIAAHGFPLPADNGIRTPVRDPDGARRRYCARLTVTEAPTEEATYTLGDGTTTVAFEADPVGDGAAGAGAAVTGATAAQHAAALVALINASALELRADVDPKDSNVVALLGTTAGAVPSLTLGTADNLELAVLGNDRPIVYVGGASAAVVRVLSDG